MIEKTTSNVAQKTVIIRKIRTVINQVENEITNKWYWKTRILHSLYVIVYITLAYLFPSLVFDGKRKQNSCFHKKLIFKDRRLTTYKDIRMTSTYTYTYCHTIIFLPLLQPLLRTSCCCSLNAKYVSGALFFFVRVSCHWNRIFAYHSGRPLKM